MYGNCVVQGKENRLFTTYFKVLINWNTKAFENVQGKKGKNVNRLKNSSLSAHCTTLS